MNGFQNPYMNPYGFQQMPSPVYPQPSQQVVKVHGEDGAKAYQMGANSSALLLDESGTMVWLATSDGAGYRTVTAYDITPHKTEPEKQYTNLESRIARLEEIINGNTADSSATWQKQPSAVHPTGKADDGHDSFRTEPTGNAEPTRIYKPYDGEGDGSGEQLRG